SPPAVLVVMGSASGLSLCCTSQWHTSIPYDPTIRSLASARVLCYAETACRASNRTRDGEKEKTLWDKSSGRLCRALIPSKRCWGVGNLPQIWTSLACSTASCG